MYQGLIKTLRMIVDEDGVPKATIVEEARGLRTYDASCLGDLMVLDFTKPGRPLPMDGVVTNHLHELNLGQSCGALRVFNQKDGGCKVQGWRELDSPGGCNPWRKPHLCALCGGKWRQD